MFRVTAPDNKENALTIQGSVSKNVSKDIATILLQNYDADTSNYYNMAAVSLRDHFGNSNENGAGDLLFKTNIDGNPSNLQERMRITHEGYVGINNHNPQYELDVDGDIALTGSLLKNGVPFTSSKWQVVGGSNVYVGEGSNVGIGKSNPAFALDVNGDVNLSGILRSNGDVFKTSQWTTSASNVYLMGSNVGFNTSNPAYRVDVNGDVNFSGTLYRNGQVYKGSLWDTDNGSNVWLLNSNVGIGTDTPQATLDVAGSVRVGGHVIPSSTETYDLGSSNNRFRDLYLAGDSIALGVTKITSGTAMDGDLFIRNLSNNEFGRIHLHEMEIHDNETLNVFRLSAASGQPLFYNVDPETMEVLPTPASGVNNVFTSNQNVGVGTATPDAGLEVYNNAGAPISFQVSHSNPDNVVVVNSNAWVGVKTLSPQHELDVNGKAYVRQGVLVPSGQGIDVDFNSGTLLLGANNAQSINIGGGLNPKNINIGGAQDVVNFGGVVNNVEVNNLVVEDKIITLNKSNVGSSGFESGILIEEAASITGYIQTSQDGASWKLKAPAATGIVSIIPGTTNYSISQSDLSKWSQSGNNIYTLNNNVGLGINNPASRLDVLGSMRSSALTASRALVSDANKNIASSSATSIEVGYLSGVTGALQTQLNGKQATITGAATTVVSANLAPGYVVCSDNNGKLSQCSVLASELANVSGATSNIQGQLNDKQTTITGAASSVVSNNLSTGFVLCADSNGKIATCGVTSATLSTLSGVTGNVQTQLNKKLEANSNITADLLFANNKGIDSTTSNDILRIGYNNAKTVFIASASGGATITIGSSNDTVIFGGSNQTVNTTTIEVVDKFVLLNQGGLSNTGSEAGIRIEEASNVTGYCQTSVDRTAWSLKAPYSGGVVNIVPGESGFTLEAASVSKWVASGSNVYVLSSNVGVGTATPQAQLDVSGTIKTSEITADRVLIASSNQTIASSGVTATELGYLTGASTNLQTQIDGKQATLTGATTSVLSSNMAASIVVVSDATGKLANSLVSTTELGYVSGVTTGIQSQLDGKQAILIGATSTVTSNNLNSAVVVVTNEEGKLANSAVTSTEVGYLVGATSSIQTQLNGKQETVTGAASTVLTVNLTASKAVVSDGNGKITNSTVSTTELGYLVGVTTNVQTQLNGKQATLTGAVSTVTTANLNADIVVISNSNGKLTSSSVTNTELGYLIGLTSNVQGQLNGKQATLTGATTTTASSNLNANIVVTSDSNGKLANSAVTSTELEYLSGLTSNVQGQLDGKQATLTGATTTTSNSNLNANIVVISDASGKLANSEVTSTELGYLTDLTSNVQGQLNGKQATLTGATTSVSTSNLNANIVVVSSSNGKLANSTVTSTELSYLGGVTAPLQGQINALGGGGWATQAGTSNIFKLNGNVGIGTSNPVFLLDVAGTMRANNVYCTTTSTAAAPCFSWSNDTNTGMYNVSADTIGWSTAGVERMRLDAAGYLGIGVTTATAPLEVVSGVAGTINVGQRHFSVNNNISQANLTTTVSIVSNSSVWVKDGFSFVASSDQRIKKDIVVADTTEALDKLTQINLYRYGYIDDSDIDPNSNNVYGLLAQQVRAVIPEAVELNTDVIPSVFSMATSASIQGYNQVCVVLPKAHAMPVGAKVRLYQENLNETIDTTLRHAPDDHTLVVDMWSGFNTQERVFVYGHEINDFHTLDKTKLALLAVGAIKELNARNKALTAEVAAIKAHLGMA